MGARQNKELSRRRRSNACEYALFWIRYAKLCNTVAFSSAKPGRLFFPLRDRKSQSVSLFELGVVRADVQAQQFKRSAVTVNPLQA